MNSGIFSELNRVYVCSDYTCSKAKKCLAFMQGKIIANFYKGLATLCKSEKECPSFIPMDHLYQLNKDHFDSNTADERFRPTNGLYLAKPIDEIRENIAVVPFEYNWVRTIFDGTKVPLVCSEGHITHKTKSGKYPTECKVCNAPIMSKVYKYMKSVDMTTRGHNFMIQEDINNLTKTYPAEKESLRYMSAYIGESVSVESGERNRFSVMARTKDQNSSKKIYLTRIKNAAGRMLSSVAGNKTPDQIYDELSVLAVAFIAEWELTSISASIRKVAKAYKARFNADMNRLYNFTEINDGGSININYDEWIAAKKLSKQVRRKKKRNVKDSVSPKFNDDIIESLNKYNNQEFDIVKIPQYDFELFLSISTSKKREAEYNDSIIGKDGVEFYRNQVMNSFTTDLMHKMKDSDIYSIKGFFYKMSSPQSKDPIINGCYNFIMDTIKTFFTFITSSKYRNDINFNKLYVDLQLCWRPFELFNYIRDGFIKYNPNLKETYQNRDLKTEQLTNEFKLSILDNINGIAPLIILFTKESTKDIIKTFNNSNDVNEGQLLNDSREYDAIADEEAIFVNIHDNDCSEDNCTGILFTTPFGKDIMNATANAYIKEMDNDQYNASQRKRNSNNTSMYSGVSIVAANNPTTCLARLTDNGETVFRTKKVVYDFNSSTLLMILLEEYLYEMKNKQVLKSKHRLNTLGNYEFYKVCIKYFKIDKYRDLITTQKYR